jgi:hypothetical protein
MEQKRCEHEYIKEWNNGLRCWNCGEDKEKKS